MTNRFIVNLFRIVLPLSLMLWGGITVQAQNEGPRVTRIYTDFNGFWTSGIGTGNQSPIWPDNIHHVVGFTYGSDALGYTTYSTGVDDALLTQYGISFTPKVYQALPVVNFPLPTGTNQFVQFGEMQDGIHNNTLLGKGSGLVDQWPFPYSASRKPTLADVLTDGKQGLDISSGFTNLPNETILTFEFTTIENVVEINDGIPDFLITQIAIPAAGDDKMWFEDENGTMVGNEFSISQRSVNSLSRTQNDLFEPSGKPTNQINNQKDIRLVAIEVSELGLTEHNYTEAKVIKYEMGGSSDVAFLAFNYNLMNIIVANNDEATTNVNTPVDITILGNDLIPGSLQSSLQQPTIVPDGEPENGTATGNANGTITYTPNPGFVGYDVFRYEIKSTALGGNEYSDQATVVVIIGESDISVTKEVNNPNATPGDNVTFTITATNNGPHDALGTKVIDQLPPGYTYVSHSISPTSENGGGYFSNNTGTWTINDMPNGANRSLTINATVNNTGPWLNTATASSLMHDPNLSNNTATASILGIPSLAVSVECPDDPSEGVIQKVFVELEDGDSDGWSITYNYTDNNNIRQTYTASGITGQVYEVPSQHRKTTGTFYVTSVTDGNGRRIDYSMVTPDLSVLARVSTCFAMTNPRLPARTTR